jgi:hypothetical protein
MNPLKFYNRNWDLIIITDRELYNGYTLEQIESRLNPAMTDYHKQDYLNNCKRVIECQISGMNTQDIESLKSYNFNLTRLYLNL